MPKFRKRPVVVEALQFDGSRASIEAVCQWANRPLDTWVDYTFQGVDDVLDPLCHTFDKGPLKISVGDWLVRTVNGVYPCKSDIFEATYEPV